MVIKNIKKIKFNKSVYYIEILLKFSYKLNKIFLYILIV